MSENKSNEQLLEEALNATVKLAPSEVDKLKEMLIDYCEVYYGALPIFNAQNRVYLDSALDWSIKRVEQRLNPRNSSTGSVVIGDGTWLANAKNYYDVLVQSKPDIGSYLNEYLDRGLINTVGVLNNDGKPRK